MGPPASVYIDIDGESLWAVIRCDETNPVPLASGGRFGVDCLTADNKIKDIDTIYRFNAKGDVVKSFGRGRFIWPHGLHVDREGNVWVTDAASAQAIEMAAKGGVKAGHQVFKFSPDGQLLMTLGEAGVGGTDERHFRSPSSVAVAANGDIFVADGHELNGNNRVMKFSKDGRFIKQWGKTGYGPGEFRTLHGIAIDRQGRIFVADRNNNRIQLFDQEGKHLSTWTQFGTPSGIAFDDRGQIYVATRNRTASTIPAGSRASASATCAPGSSPRSSWTRAAIRERKPAAAPNSSPSTKTATCSAANPARACCANTSRCGSSTGRHDGA